MMVAGQAGLGKTTFLRTLFKESIFPPTISVDGGSLELPQTTETITPYKFEYEADDGVRLSLDVIDTPGYNDDFSAEQSSAEILSYIQSTFDDVFEEEQRVHRNPKFEEHRVHVLLYFVEPTGLGLKQADKKFIKNIAHRINVVPIIAKADSLSPAELTAFKTKITNDLMDSQIRIFDFASFGSSENIHAVATPFAVIGSSFTKDARLGRSYPWGFVDVLDSAACDFVLLKRCLLEEFRDDLKETTEDGLYEAYRTEKLLKSKTETPIAV